PRVAGGREVVALRWAERPARALHGDVAGERDRRAGEGRDLGRGLALELRRVVGQLCPGDDSGRHGGTAERDEEREHRDDEGRARMRNPTEHGASLGPGACAAPIARTVTRVAQKSLKTCQAVETGGRRG